MMTTFNTRCRLLMIIGISLLFVASGLIADEAVSIVENNEQVAGEVQSGQNSSKKSV